MTQVTVFRKDCDECGRSFSARDRKERFCPKCVGKVKAREELARKAREKKPPPTPPAPKPAEQEPQVLTGEVKDRVIKEYETYRDRPDYRLKKIHQEIARKLGVGRALVVEALRGIVPKRVLTAEEEAEVIKRYRDYVERMERPCAGRRKTIAKDLAIPFRLVASAVQRWKRTLRPVEELTREQRFQIEKTYFRLLEEKTPLKEIIDDIGSKSSLSHWQILRWLDSIHDGEKLLKNVPGVTEEQQRLIISGYLDYLSGPAPPGPFLHTLLAEKSGATYKQVHKVLLNYRLNRLRDIQG
ncbi:MAG: hypothetical protein HXY45_07740 [Syntrophaceae bacterium]|nr:hypothetical protein [Syntrophaceae bacterium]